MVYLNLWKVLKWKEAPDWRPRSCANKNIQADQGCSVSSRLRCQALNWEPLYPEGEDETSMKRHREMLRVEWVQRSKEKMEHVMMLTFPERRRQIYQQLEILELKTEFLPCLISLSKGSTDYIFLHFLFLLTINLQGFQNLNTR